MTWEYKVSTGVMTHNGAKFGHCYSGSAEAKNKPECEQMSGKGPIPRGIYVISGINNHKGPHTVVLEPIAGTNTFGRSAFLIHGDNKKHIGNSSEGCIILNGDDLRTQIYNSGDTILVVR